MSLLDNVHTHDDGRASHDAFKKIFRVGVQNAFLKTPELIHWMGTPTTGDKKLDKQLQNRFVEINATPIACVEYYEMGAPIRFRNSETAASILNILLMHLKNWNYIASTMYNVKLPPEEDMEAISNFCEVMVKFSAANKRRDSGSFILRKEIAMTRAAGGVTGQNKDRRIRQVLDQPNAETNTSTQSSNRQSRIKEAFQRMRQESS